MNLFNLLFRQSSIPRIIPLEKKGNIQHELQIQCASIMEAGYEVLEVVNKASTLLILYRQMDEEQPKEEQRDVFLRLRIITKKGRLHPEPVLKAFFNEGFTEIELSDIDIKEQMVNGGYGSILLNCLKQIAKDREARTIRGWISEVDRGHLERLVHFYQKHGFEVTLQDDKNSIRIGNLLWSNNHIT